MASNDLESKPSCISNRFFLHVSETKSFLILDSVEAISSYLVITRPSVIHSCLSMFFKWPGFYNLMTVTSLRLNWVNFFQGPFEETSL